MPSKETVQMILNQDIVAEARKIVSNADTALPAEIPGFPGLFVASPDEDAIEAIGAFVASDGISYKIGTRSAN